MCVKYTNVKCLNIFII